MLCIMCIINYNFIFCLWLHKLCVSDYPFSSIIRATPSPPLPRVIESTLYCKNKGNGCGSVLLFAVFQGSLLLFMLI